jgi:hypothetical protein
MSRAKDLDRFYDLLRKLERRLGGCRRLDECDARMGWPAQGVYFFFERGEERSAGRGQRVVRIGTHAVSQGSRTTLWQRLVQHRGLGGASAGGGNHRGSIFRLHVGTALLRREPQFGHLVRTWGHGASAPAPIRAGELPLETRVSQVIGQMPFLWLSVAGPAGPTNDRKLIEAGAIALLSNLDRSPLDPPSPGWLGRDAAHAAVRGSGLWNVSHVEEQPRIGFLDLLERYVQGTPEREWRPKA